MNDTLHYCDNYNCDNYKCKYNIAHCDPRTFARCKVSHLEGHPDYCTKPNWYGYQVKPEQVGNSSSNE